MTLLMKTKDKTIANEYGRFAVKTYGGESIYRLEYMDNDGTMCFEILLVKGER